MSRSSDTFDGRVPPPDCVVIETTLYCNLSCSMCLPFQAGTTVKGPHMLLEDFERWAEQVFPFVTRFQPTVAGEPLMSKGLPRMIELARKYGVKIDMVTNGTLLNPRMRGMLVPALGKITISFDAGTKEIFEAMREGSVFETVRENVRALCVEVRALPPDQRPIIELNCVLRRLNVRDLDNLVDLARELGVDWLNLSHMYPANEEMKAESLAHDVALARKCIDRALERASRVGLTLVVGALDQIIASSAVAGDGPRHFATVDGVVEGLEAKSVGAGGWAKWPVQFSERDPDHAEIQRRRRAAWEGTGYQRPLEAGARGRGVRDRDLPDSIWHCDYLWNKAYVLVKGDVVPCCVPGAPSMGSLTEKSFEDIWNSPNYREMRNRMVRRDPVKFCKGCQHIRQVTDKAAIRRALQGRQLPDLESVALPDGPPELNWQAVPDARGYELEFSLDGFATVVFSTSWHGPLLDTNRYTIPVWVWDQAPRPLTVQWRALALQADGVSRSQVTRGLLDVA